MIDYIDIPMGSDSPKAGAQYDPEASITLPLREILHRIHVSPIKNARLIGGEPLLSPHFEEIAGALRINGFQRIRVQTGGWALRNKELRLRIFVIGVRLFEVRFYSSRANEHNAIVKKRGSFGTAQSALHHIYRAGKKLTGGGRTFSDIRIIVTPENAPHMDRIITEASQWRAANQLTVVPGRFPFSLQQAAEKITTGIENALAVNKWVYLDHWPACLFPGHLLHVKEATRYVSGPSIHPKFCSGCHYRCFCRGVPEGHSLDAEQLSQSSFNQQNDWPDFYRRIILQDKATCQ